MEDNDDSSVAGTGSAAKKLPAKFVFHERRYLRPLLRVLMVVCAVVGLMAVLAVGYLGFVPGLSKVLGAQAPRALGVTYSEADYERYLAKSGVTLRNFADAPHNPNNPSAKQVFADPRSLSNAIFTQEEITAAINSSGWVWMPLHNVQVRFSDDSVIEVSGNLNIKHIGEFIRFIGGVGYSEADVNRAVGFGRKFIGDAAVYVRARTTVKDTVASIDIQQLQVGRYTVPHSVASRVFQEGTKNALSRTPNFKAEEVTCTSGQLHYDGTYPSTVYVKTAER